MKKTVFKFVLLALVACLASIAIYYYVVPERDRIPFSIQIKTN
jgi:hypothetical protein